MASSSCAVCCSGQVELGLGALRVGWSWWGAGSFVDKPNFVLLPELGPMDRD